MVQQEKNRLQHTFSSVFRYFGSVCRRNRNRSRTPNFTELKTETEPKNRTTDYSVRFRFGSVRFSVSGKKMPRLIHNHLISTKIKTNHRSVREKVLPWEAWRRMAAMPDQRGYLPPGPGGVGVGRRTGASVSNIDGSGIRGSERNNGRWRHPAPEVPLPRLQTSTPMMRPPRWLPYTGAASRRWPRLHRHGPRVALIVEHQCTHADPQLPHARPPPAAATQGGENRMGQKNSPGGEMDRGAPPRRAVASRRAARGATPPP